MVSVRPLRLGVSVVRVSPMPYRPDVLDQLARHGLRPAADTPPSLARDVVEDLYRYEIRRLRDRLLAGAIAKADYAGAVRDLRTRYPVLSLPLPLWTE